MTLRTIHSCWATRAATTIAAFVSLALVALGSPASAHAQSAEPWPTREFEVVSSEMILPGPGGSHLLSVFNELSEQVDEWLTAWGMEPTGARIYVPHAETRREIEKYLSEAAGLLEGWGFPPPRLHSPFGKYKIVLAVDTPTGETLAGSYHPPVCGFSGGFLFLSATHILGQEQEDGRRALTPDGRETLAHELFHAVQANTRFEGWSCPPTTGRWIIEGTADAIGSDVLRRLRGEESSSWIKAWGARGYSKRLPVPLVRSLLPQEWSEDRMAAYYTSSFWRYLAEFRALGSAPGPEINPVDYSYLAEMLSRQPASSDCVGSGAECDSELRWLTIGLRDAFGLTLREVYPLFMDAFALYGEHRIAASKAEEYDKGQAWRNRTFSLPGDDSRTGCQLVHLKPDPSRRVHREVIAFFDDIAAECWEVKVQGFEGDVPVQIEVRAPPHTTALSDLSAVVAGRPMRADTAVVHDDPTTGQPTATWVEVFPLDELRPFLLTNVAHDPANTTRMVNLPISFTALETNALVRVSGGGGSGGSGASGGPPIGGPSAGFGATRWWFGVHTSDEIAAATPASQSPPPGNACRVQLTLVSEDVVGDEDVFVDLHGWVPAPLAPGSWLVGDVSQSENGIGEFIADVGVPCEFGGCVPSGPSKGHKYRMVGFHGDLEFTDVGRSHASGRFDITAGGDEQYAGLRLTGIYSVTLGGPAGAGEKTLRADHPCAPPPPGSKPGAPGGSGGNPAPSDAPGDEPAESGDGDPGTDGEEDAPDAADGAAGEPEPSLQGAPGVDGEASDQDDDGPPPDTNPETPGGEARGSALILAFPQAGRSVLRSEPQAVRGTGTGSGVALASESYDLTVALPLFGCTVEMGDVPAAEQYELAVAHQRWLQSGRTVQGLVLFDFTTAELRLDATGGAVTLSLQSAEGGVTMRGTAESAVNLRGGGPTKIVGDVSAATLEITRGDDTFGCTEPMDFSFTVAGTD